MTCPGIGDLERFVQQELDEITRAHVAEHISSCSECSGVIADLNENARMAEALRRQSNHAGFLNPLTTDDAPPESIGPYRIIRKLGEGGMGTVYEAEQQNPQRLVALKVIRPGFVSSRMLQRFEHEVQVLGRLLHPGIAQVHEAGTHRTPDGASCPYFVMELVHGSSLLEFARAKSLRLRDRLELMAKVCDAVQHAHQRGVIHRDLKPDNILIDDSQPDAPQPKILDFGVARIVDPDATTTLHTSVGQIIGTVAYMSPEQARAEPSEIDTRSDVYALGVICFQLLCGKLPYTLNDKSVADTIRAIVHDEPTPLASIDRSLRGDVTTIVGKALEKEKLRRYESAAEMSADLRRHLRDEPILAHPPSTIYQVRKFARRNKGLVAGIIATIVVLLAGVIGTSIGMVRARSAQVKTLIALTAADKSAAEVRKEAAKQAAVNDFLQSIVLSANPRNLTAEDRAKGRGASIVDVLDSASRKVDAGSFKNQPSIEVAVRKSIAISYKELGSYADSDQHLQAAIELARSVHGEQSAEMVELLITQTSLRSDQGKLADAEAIATEAVEIARKVYGDAPHNNVAGAVGALAQIYQLEGKPQLAEPMLREVLALELKMFGPDRNETARAMNNLAFVLNVLGKDDEARSLFERSLAIRRRVLGDHPETATVINNLAAMSRDAGDYAQAESMFREALEMRRKTLGDEDVSIAAAMVNLASVYQMQKKWSDAEPLYMQALEMQKKFVGDEHPAVATMLNNIGGLMLQQNKFPEAEKWFSDSLEVRRKVLDPGHPQIASTMANLADAILQQGRASEAEPLLRDAVEIVTARSGADHPETASRRVTLARCLLEMNNTDEAERELLSAYEVLKSQPTNRHTTTCVKTLVKLYTVKHEANEAAKWQARVPATRQTKSTTAATQSPKS